MSDQNKKLKTKDQVLCPHGKVSYVEYKNGILVAYHPEDGSTDKSDEMCEYFNNTKIDSERIVKDYLKLIRKGVLKDKNLKEALKLEMVGENKPPVNPKLEQAATILIASQKVVV